MVCGKNKQLRDKHGNTPNSASKKTVDRWRRKQELLKKLESGEEDTLDKLEID